MSALQSSRTPSARPIQSFGPQICKRTVEAVPTVDMQFVASRWGSGHTAAGCLRVCMQADVPRSQGNGCIERARAHVRESSPDTIKDARKEGGPYRSAGAASCIQTRCGLLHYVLAADVLRDTFTRTVRHVVLGENLAADLGKLEPGSSRRCRQRCVRCRKPRRGKPIWAVSIETWVTVETGPWAREQYMFLDVVPCWPQSCGPEGRSITTGMVP